MERSRAQYTRMLYAYAYRCIIIVRKNNKTDNNNII